jgi:hypothetical protein
MEFWFVIKAHLPMHSGIYVGGCIAVDGPKDKKDVSLNLAAALCRPDSLIQIKWRVHT